MIDNRLFRMHVFSDQFVAKSEILFQFSPFFSCISVIESVDNLISRRFLSLSNENRYFFQVCICNKQMTLNLGWFDILERLISFQFYRQYVLCISTHMLGNEALFASSIIIHWNTMCKESTVNGNKMRIH